jgi:hypothetical protein
MAARLYADRLTRFLDWIGRFFGDAAPGRLGRQPGSAVAPPAATTAQGPTSPERREGMSDAGLLPRRSGCFWPAVTRQPLTFREALHTRFFCPSPRWDLGNCGGTT